MGMQAISLTRRSRRIRIRSRSRRRSSRRRGSSTRTKNYAISSQAFIDHLARYADKDTIEPRKGGLLGGTGFRACRRKLADACALYDGVIYRYGSNWYGYLAAQRIAA